MKWEDVDEAIKEYPFVKGARKGIELDEKDLDGSPWADYKLTVEEVLRRRPQFVYACIYKRHAVALCIYSLYLASPSVSIYPLYIICNAYCIIAIVYCTKHSAVYTVQ